jgi:hypothetical protein
MTWILILGIVSCYYGNNVIVFKQLQKLVLLFLVFFKVVPFILGIWPCNNISHIQHYLFLVSQVPLVNMKLIFLKVKTYWCKEQMWSTLLIYFESTCQFLPYVHDNVIMLKVQYGLFGFIFLVHLQFINIKIVTI